MKYGILLLFYFCVTGCMGMGYHHKVVNIGNQFLYGVNIRLHNQKFSHGYLPPGAHKSYSGGSFKISRGDKVTVIWGLNEKSRCSKEIYVDKYPWSREVVFNLNGKDVTVGFERLP